jgi:hypothetical protein
MSAAGYRSKINWDEAFEPAHDDRRVDSARAEPWHRRGAVKRYARELVEWWEVQSRRDPAEKREWVLGHPIFAPLGRFSDAVQVRTSVAS